MNFQGKKMWNNNGSLKKMQKYPVDKTSQNKSCLLRLLKSRLVKDEISAGPEKTFCPNPKPLTHQHLKQRQKKTKIHKTMLSATLPPLPIIGFPRKVCNIRIEMQISIPF